MVRGWRVGWERVGRWLGGEGWLVSGFRGDVGGGLVS